MNLASKELPNFKNLDAVDGTIFGRYNKVSSINPYKCRFVATYPDGSIINGINLFQTGWDQIPQGISKLKYELSTGHVIEIPKFKAYMPTIEVSFGVDGSRVFHFINVNCLAEKEIIIYKIVLRQDKISKYKIGDIIMSKQPLPNEMGLSWKFTA